MEAFKKMKALLESTEADVAKFADKGNNSAGTRVRQAMQEIKKLAQELRVDIQTAKNQT